MTGFTAKKLFELPCAPVISSDRAGWSAIQLALFDQPPHRIPEHVSPSHVVCINAGTDVTLEQSIDGRTYTGESVTGDVGIYPAHLWQAFEWHQRAKFLQLYLEPIAINRVGSELYGQDSIELVPQPMPFDPVINQIAIALQNTLAAQKNGSQLYADTICRHDMPTRWQMHWRCIWSITIPLRKGLGERALRPAGFLLFSSDG